MLFSILSAAALASYQLPPGNVQGPPAPEVILPAEPDLRLQDHYRAQARGRFWTLQALNVVDATTTCIILARGGEEKNPLFHMLGKPTCGKVVGIKAGFSLLEWLLLRKEIEEKPQSARKSLLINIGIQLGADIWNVTQLAR